MQNDFSHLVDLFPPTQKLPCPKCGGSVYVFGVSGDNDEKEILACSKCGHSFNYPCPACGKNSSDCIKKTTEGFLYECSSCHHSYEKPAGWLERPKNYQEKLRAFFERKKTLKERILKALQ